MEMLINRVMFSVIRLPRSAKRIIAFSLDAGISILTVWFAFYLRLGEWVALSGDGWPAAIASLIVLPIFIACGVYRSVFRYVSWESFASIGQAAVVYGVIYWAIFTAFGIEGVPRTVGIIQPILMFVTVSASRAFGRYWLTATHRERLRRYDRKHVLVYGAGTAGRQLVFALADSSDMRVVGLVDDERNLRGSIVAGIKVYPSDQLPETVERLQVAEILLAIPSASRRRRNEILALVRSIGVAVRTLPDLLDIARGHITVNDLRPLEVEDLLGREAVSPDAALLKENIHGRTVLVTGAGGSIGSELCRQIVAQQPTTLLLVDSSEFALYSIHRDLEKICRDLESRVELVPLLASVSDPIRMGRIFSAWRPQTVYHAAAYKHVPLVEHNICDGVQNNVIGTWVCGRIAKKFGTASFVLVSTDKAVRPTNVMGASKRLAEMVLQAFAAEQSSTRFSMVRFGNVLGSSGSVVPLFRQQIASGGPVTVTHRDVTRYFMTIPEAAQLVLQAGSMATGGEVFVLDMAEPVKIWDLALRMIELSGLKVRDSDNPDGDIEIVCSGLRPGEKLYEELLIGNDPIATNHLRVMMARESHLPLEVLTPSMARLRQVLQEQDVEGVLAVLGTLVPEYSCAVQIVDWIHAQEMAQQEHGVAPTLV